MGVAILPAERESALDGPGGPRDQGGGRADQHIARHGRTQPVSEGFKLGQVGAQPVHLPVSRHQLAQIPVLPLSLFGRGRIAACPGRPPSLSSAAIFIQPVEVRHDSMDAQLSKSWMASLLMGGLALSFIVWGIADVFTGQSSDGAGHGGLDRDSAR